jgi:hypothetical protein
LADSKWKETILRSGLPLEYEIKTYLSEKGCISNYEFSYIRKNDTSVERAFSYDLDASLTRDPHFVKFMIECKYRHPNTKWIFLPSEYAGPDDVYSIDFMHPMDLFCEEYSSCLQDPYYPEFAPLCSKGVEIFDNETNNKTLDQATSQIAYAFADQIAESIENQTKKLMVSEIIFYHVPMIVTTAELHMLKPGTKISQIMQASTLSDVADEFDALVLQYSPNIELKRHSIDVLYEYLKRETGSIEARANSSEIVRSKLSSYSGNLNRLIDIYSNKPRAFVILNVSKNKESLDRFFRYLMRALFPPEGFLEEILERRRKKNEEIREKLEAHRRTRSEGKQDAKGSKVEP